MSYPPPQNALYPPHSPYLQQLSPQQSTAQQLSYNVPANIAQYQNGKSAMHPQVIISSYNPYTQPLNVQQQQQQQHAHPHPHPPPQQYVNPQIFQQPTLQAISPSPFIHGSVATPPAQYGQSPVNSATASSRSPIIPAPSMPTPSSYYSPPSSVQNQSGAHGHHPQVLIPTPTTTAAAASSATITTSSSSSSSSSSITPLQKPVAVGQIHQIHQQPAQKSVVASSPAVSPSSASRAVVSAPPVVQHSTPKKQVQRKPKQSSTEKHKKPPVDYHMVLLSLADEYLNAAHMRGTTISVSSHGKAVEEYYKLIATGLGCLEAVLKNWRLTPRVEALVRLRYARILFEETDNDLEAETALSKGIDLCERNRMLDLKYSMQLLLARMLHKTNPKASLKAVDGMIEDVEAYRHTAWEYVFRLLRVSLALSSPSHQEFVSALQQLQKVSNLAKRNGDKAVLVVAALIEALAHLQHSSNHDAIEQAQRSVAAARSHQLNDDIRNIPQLNTLIQMVDISCSLLDYDLNQSAQKLSVLQDLMDSKLADDHWRPDGSFSIPLNGKSVGPSSIDTSDILHVENGTLVLTFNWLPQADLYAMCYFLSALTLSAQNPWDGRKAEKFVQEGLRMIKGKLASPDGITESVVNATKRIEWRRMLYCNILLEQIFLACSRTDWELASRTLTELRQAAEEVGDNALPAAIEAFIAYASGVIAQGVGDLESAVVAFQSPLLSLSPSTSKSTRNDPVREISILAALNTILIVRDPEHPSHEQLPDILACVESFCKSSPNKYIQAAYYLVCATVQTDSTIQTKQFLQQALQCATSISNSQITCMSLTFMSWKYFRGVVGEQAEKSARAGRATARKANNRLWVSVTDEMLADALETQGKEEESRAVREEGQRVTAGLPAALKQLV